MQTQIRRRRARRLIRVSTVRKRLSHVSLGISKSHSRVYLKLKLDSSNTLCRRVYSVYNGLIGNGSITKPCIKVSINWPYNDLVDHYSMLPIFKITSYSQKNSLDLHRTAKPGATLSLIPLRAGLAEMNTSFLFFLSIQN